MIQRWSIFPVETNPRLFTHCVDKFVETSFRKQRHNNTFILFVCYWTWSSSSFDNRTHWNSDLVRKCGRRRNFDKKPVSFISLNETFFVCLSKFKMNEPLYRDIAWPCRQHICAIVIMAWWGMLNPLSRQSSSKMNHSSSRVNKLQADSIGRSA